MDFSLVVGVDPRWRITHEMDFIRKSCVKCYIVDKNFPMDAAEGIIVVVSGEPGIVIVAGGTSKPSVYVKTLHDALEWCAGAIKRKQYGISDCVVSGGRDLCNDALDSAYCRHVFVRDDDAPSSGEVFPKERLDGWHRSAGASVCKYSYVNAEEKAYQDLLSRLLTAPVRPNRTGIDTRGLFHEALKFKLSCAGTKVLPLLTTKRVPWKSIYHELIWFLRGSTDTSYLKEHGVTIWDGNSTREFLDSRGLGSYEPGELGPIYGAQWRNCGSTYICQKKRNDPANGVGAGVDQIAGVIKTLKTNPWDRRMIVSSWNVKQLDQMALPACHYSFQFHVDPDDKGSPTYLNCIVNMRSADCFLGVPFNVASYGFLTHIIAHLTGLTAGTLSISMADCHLYTNHITAAKKLIERNARRFPTISFGPAIGSDSTIDDFAHNFVFSDYTISEYYPHPTIKADMAI